MNTTITVEIDDASLDRLVDGELSERDRSALLRALDREPNGWKRCAIAFLEAQTWRQAAADVVADDRSSLIAPAKPPCGSPTRRGTFVRQAFAVAAAVIVAFCTGFAFRDARQPQTLMTRRGSAMESTVVPSKAVALPANDAMRGAPAVPEYVRLQLERQGYQVKGDRKVVAIALDDGRKVAVPVETVSYRYVGQRIH